ncbi:hypothetical protein RYX36_000942 [Vicia faba]
MGTEVVVDRWGTWEELLLGGAVLRHGTQAWNVVAAELRARAVCSDTFTPEVCKAKYEDLRQRYSGSTAWFEELKKRRVEELKKAMERSEVSIGSLQSKLEVLEAEKNEKKDDCKNGLESPVSHIPSKKLQRVESSTKDTSKDDLSAGSFTHETRLNWSPESQLPAASADDNETKPEVSQSTEQIKVPNVDNLANFLYEGQIRTCRKPRGKRKRKDCSRSIKEAASVGESDLIDSADVLSWCKESSTSNCGEVAKSSDDVDNRNKNLKKRYAEDMIEILDSIFETKGASAFRRRLDSQKRGRYKKMIRQHMDFDTIRSRISIRTIKSTVELFRDLLLLTNNALVFYSKNTREYKTALVLRDIVTKKMRENFKGSNNSTSSSKVSKITEPNEPNESVKLPVHNVHVKPRSVRPGNRKIVAKAGGGNNSASGMPHSQGAKKPVKADSSPSVESLKVVKKSLSRPKRVERVTSCQKITTPTKGKKRVRTKP